MYKEGSLWTGACELEHADGSVLRRVCNQKGEGGVINFFVACLLTTYLYENGIMQTGSCGWKHVNGSMLIGASGWEHANRSMGTGVW